MKKIKIIFIILVLGGSLYFIFSAISALSNLKEVGEVIDYRTIFKKDVNSKHFESQVYKNSDTVSVYTFNNYEKGFIVFRKKSSEKNLMKLFSVVGSTLERPNPDLPKGVITNSSIFNKNFAYLYNDLNSIDKIDFFIDNTENLKINFESDSVISLEFYLNSPITLMLNKSEVVFHSNEINNIEKNELLILLENQYIYFVYSRPTSKANNDIKLLDLIVR